MLFVVVIEFFICWSPLYVLNTIALFNPKAVYQNLGYTAISFLQLLSFSSCCCNPITYCFMNIGFRKAFKNLFRCFYRHDNGRRISLTGYCATSAHSASAEAQILAATVNSLMNGNGDRMSSNSTSNNSKDENECAGQNELETFSFQENPKCFSLETTTAADEDCNHVITTQFNSWRGEKSVHFLRVWCMCMLCCECCQMKKLKNSQKIEFIFVRKKKIFSVEKNLIRFFHICSSIDWEICERKLEWNLTQSVNKCWQVQKIRENSFFLNRDFLIFRRLNPDLFTHENWFW